uniref:Retrotransposon Orf1 n=1 Tax=Tanacetum cinerariifolium TaxID=118510 RepID=A0A699J3B2_TANCI|nr:retrotransposon Orf1 [Tanacetum cinerariifolium]
MENIMYFNNGAGPSSSVGTPLTQEEAKKWVLAHSISIRYEMLKEVRPVIETLAYNDKYRNLLDKIWADKVSLDGKIKPDEERVMLKVKGQMIKEKKDPGAFIFPITLEGLINENALADTRSDINTMPYRIYKQLGRDDIMKEDRNITMINYIEAEVTGRLVNFYTSGAYDHKVGSSRPKRFRHVETVEEALLPNVHHEFLEWSGCSLEAKSRYNIRAFNIQEPIYPELFCEFYATYEFDEVCADDELQSNRIISFRLGGRAHNLTLLEFARRLGLYHVEELDEEGFDTYF